MGDSDLTRQEVLEALSQVDHLYRALVDQSFQGFAILRGVPPRIVFANATLARMLGSSIEEVLSLSPGEAERLLHPEEHRFLPRYQERLEGRPPSDRRALRIVRRDGEVRWLSAITSRTVYQGRPAVLVVTMDITEQQVAEQALRQSEQNYRALVEQSFQGLVISKGDPPRVEYVNSTMAEIVGYSVEELTAMTYEQIVSLVHPRDRSLFIQRTRDRATGTSTPMHYTIRLVRKDGAMRWVEIMSSRIDYFGEPAVQAAFLDITERKQAEQERQDLQAQLQHAQKLESLGVMAGGVAHDFNNLLMGILGNADLALAGLPLTSPLLSCVTDIKEASLRAADLCSQLLAYSGKSKFVVRPLSLSTIVQEMGHLVALAVGRKAELRYDLAADLPAIEADASQIRQILLNLVTNASEALADRTGLVTVSTGLMSCDEAFLQGVAINATTGAGQYVFLEVTDNGCGMDAETMSRVFDPFFTTKFTGRGLGLAAVLGVVRAHQGALAITSELNRGSSIRVIFPRSELPSDKRDHDEPGTDDWRGSGTVLLVDDEPIIHRVSGRMLQKLGFDLLTAHDGEEAIRLFHERSDSIVMVLLDLTMPRMSGEETFRELRRIRADVQILLSSGFNERDAAERFEDLDCTGFIQKPYSLATLQLKLRQMLQTGDER